jgi:hypothetical protein
LKTNSDQEKKKKILHCETAYNNCEKWHHHVAVDEGEDEGEGSQGLREALVGVLGLREAETIVFRLPGSKRPGRSRSFFSFDQG